ncbi:probable Pyranose 2-oxidase [Armillaria ostoyae]|uniref:Pyranose 2-oxidase n=1 Tax=Armillaria ostoyae TaxID=47428 RepID=A0A284REN3_ARMOS|nr:probable Pyranose 2-oxidase [Armillaria ostoyae]
MSFRLSDEVIQSLLTQHLGAGDHVVGQDRGTLCSDQFDRVIFTDVFIAGSGPIASTYARTIITDHADDNVRVLMADIGAQDSPVIGAHQKNAIKFQKDIDAFVHTIKGALQTTSIPVPDSYQPTLAGVSWAPHPAGGLVINGFNPSQKPSVNLPANATTRTIGGMATHWTCACPEPHSEERSRNPIEKQELDRLLERGKALLNVHTDEFDQSIRHRVVKRTLTDSDSLAGREVKSLPLAAERRTTNKAYVTWSGVDTVLGTDLSHNTHPRFTLHAETRVTRLVYDSFDRRIVAALIRDLKADCDRLVIAKAYVVACGSVCTPQILWNSNIRPEALGRNLTEQSIAFCQIVLKRSIVDAIRCNPDYKEQVENHCKHHPCDPLPIPFDDPEPQVTIPYSSNHKWHTQIHRDAFSYGDVGPRSDPRVVVDLRFFGKSDILDTNMVTFDETYTDIYGMPQATFCVQRTREDGERDHEMMKDMTNIANILGGYLPGSEPQFMEPGLALHITGTTRIGVDPKTSVADPSSKVHGFRNLWVGGNGCIPDSTACNPTLTSVAIAIKGAESVVAYMRRIKDA